jgi:hypothetical protein
MFDMSEDSRMDPPYPVFVTVTVELIGGEIE